MTLGEASNKPAEILAADRRNQAKIGLGAKKELLRFTETHLG